MNHLELSKEQIKLKQQQAVWQSVIGMPLGDDPDDANEAAFYAEFPAELADELANDLLQFARANASEMKEQWVYWTVSVLTQPPNFYRLLQSLIPDCPVNFEVFGRLRHTFEENEDKSRRVAIASARAELQLFASWLESTGLWNKRPGSEHRVPKGTTTVEPDGNMVTPEDVALKLKTKNINLTPKTLKNTRKAAWGTPDGKEGKAELFDWDRIRPIVEKQFGVKFEG